MFFFVLSFLFHSAKGLDCVLRSINKVIQVNMHTVTFLNKSLLRVSSTNCRLPFFFLGMKTTNEKSSKTYRLSQND